jgi:hypothetical protein
VCSSDLIQQCRYSNDHSYTKPEDATTASTECYAQS